MPCLTQFSCRSATAERLQTRATADQHGTAAFITVLTPRSRPDHAGQSSSLSAALCAHRSCIIVNVLGYRAAPQLCICKLHGNVTHQAQDCFKLRLSYAVARRSQRSVQTKHSRARASTTNTARVPPARLARSCSESTCLEQDGSVTCWVRRCKAEQYTVLPARAHVACCKLTGWYGT
jgi:hypothetical protein